MALDVMRILPLISQVPEIKSVKLTVIDEVAEYLNNKKRGLLTKIEEEGDFSIILKGVNDVWPEHLEIECLSESGQIIPFTYDGM